MSAHRLGQFRPKADALISLAVCVVVVVTLAQAREGVNQQSEPSKAVINWTPASLSGTISPGGSKLFSVSFVSTKNLEHVHFDVPATLAGLISVQPPSLESVHKDISYSINILAAASPSASVGTLSGSVRIIRVTDKDNSAKDGSDIDTPDGPRDFPLPITVNIWNSFVAPSAGVSFQFPPTMQVQLQTDATGNSEYISATGEEFTGGITVRKLNRSLSSILSDVTSTLHIVNQIDQTYNGRIWTVYTFQEDQTGIQFVDAFIETGGATYQIGSKANSTTIDAITAILSTFVPM